MDGGAAAPAAWLAAASGAAETVDREACFPEASIAALRREGRLAALIPAAQGGGGAGLAEVAATCYALGRACGSTAMIFAMHQVQVACLLRHGGDAWHRAFLHRIAAQGLLLGSVTSEAGVGGEMRRSLCAIETHGRHLRLRKRATTVSYGAEADALLITARRNPEAAGSDQVLLVVPREGYVLRRTGQWDAMGMRGTVSHPFDVAAAGDRCQILTDRFATIAARTMVPVSHLLWSACWAGIAADAIARARRLLRRRARDRTDDTLPQGAHHLARAVEMQQAQEARIRLALQHADGDGWADDPIAVNGLKAGTAETCLAVAQHALSAAGLAGYAQSGPTSLSRHLRDLLAAPLMIGNDRIRDNSARLLLGFAPTLGI